MEIHRLSTDIKFQIVPGRSGVQSVTHERQRESIDSAESLVINKIVLIVSQIPSRCENEAPYWTEMSSESGVAKKTCAGKALF